MAARDIKSVDEITVVDVPNGQDTQLTSVDAVPVPAPGRKLSFEEAVLATTEQYDEALRGLAQ